MAYKLSNFARMSLAQSVALAATTMYVSAANAALLPSLGATDQATAILFDGTNKEIVYITAWTAGGTLTVTRAQESTTARDWPSGTVLIHTPTAGILQQVLSAVTAVVFTGTATNVGNAYTVNVGAGGTLPTFTNGEEISFEIPADNTGAVTLAVTNGTTTIAAKSITHQDHQALESGDFQDDWYAVVRYNSAADHYELISPTSNNLHATQLNDAGVPAVSRHPNGRMDFWNNGTSFNTVASGTETADGWYVIYDGTIGAFTVARQTFTTGQTDVPGDPRYFLRWDQSAAGSGSTIRRLRVPMPGVEWRNGEQVTRRFWAKADSSRSVTAKLLQNFGTGGSPSAEVEADSDILAFTSTWTEFTVTTTLPSIAGKSIGSNLDDTLYLTLDLPLNVTMTIDITVDDFRPGHTSGLQSDTFPLPWWKGGVGGSFASSADFIDVLNLLTESTFASWFTTNYPDVDAIEALAGTSGLLAKTAANSWTLRSLTTGTATVLTITNPAGVAGNPNVDVPTSLVNYVADPLSVAELASVTAAFGTAAFVADSGLAHLAGVESFSARKNFINAGLWIADSDASHHLNIKPGSNQTADKTFTLTLGDNDRTLDLSAANVTISAAAATVLDDASVSAMCTTLGAAQLAASNTFTAANIISNAAPTLRWYETGAAVDTKYWDIFISGGALFWRCVNDGYSSAGTYLTVTRSGSTPLVASFDVCDLRIAAAPASLATNSAGFRGVPSNSGEKAANFTGVLTDAGGAVPFTAAAQYTIPTNASVAHPLGTTIMLPSLNGGGNLTVHPDTGVTLRRGDGSAGTGDRIVPANAAGWIWKRGTDEWYIYGTFT